MVRNRCRSPWVTVTFWLKALSNNCLRSGSSDGAFRLRPLGLPLCPGLNWYFFGGRPVPTLYSASEGLEGKASLRLSGVDPSQVP